MALTIEDGSIVTGADSWVTRAEFIAYALARGVIVADEDATDVYLVKAAAFIDDHEANLKGWRVERDQPLSFPRGDLYIEDWYWQPTEIPRQVKLCQMAYALDMKSGVDIYNPPQNPGLIAKSKRVEGAVSVSYAVSDTSPQKLGRTSTGEALLASLLNANGMSVIQLVRA
jgi:hypothetical protein